MAFSESHVPLSEAITLSAQTRMLSICVNKKHDRNSTGDLHRLKYGQVTTGGRTPQVGNRKSTLSLALKGVAWCSLAPWLGSAPA